eukprot:366433-Chlamydomonas_euryale.AAC.5
MAVHVYRHAKRWCKEPGLKPVPRLLYQHQRSFGACITTAGMHLGTSHAHDQAVARTSVQTPRRGMGSKIRRISQAGYFPSRSPHRDMSLAGSVIATFNRIGNADWTMRVWGQAMPERALTARSAG